MKKLKILIPSLITTASMPLVSLAGCNNDNSKQWVVQFDTNGGTFIDTTRVEDGQYLDEPEEPEKTGFKFSGWFKDEELKNRYYFNEPVTENMTIYVGWEPTDAKLTLHFSTDGGGTISKSTVDVAPGTKWSVLAASGQLPTPSPIEKFQGWFIGDEELKPNDKTPIDSEWFITAHFADQGENIAYIMDSPEGLSLSNTDVIIGQTFITYINATDTIKSSWVRTVINGDTTITQPSIETISSKQLKLTVDNPTGDIALVISNESEYHSYICNKPSDGFTIVDGVSTYENQLAIVQSSQTIDQIGAIQKVAIDDRELDLDDYHYEIVQGEPNQAKIILDDGVINGDVFIWMEPLEIYWDSESDQPYPYPVEPLESADTPEEALLAYYDWIVSNRKNYINDFASALWEETPIMLRLRLFATDIDVKINPDNLIQCSYKINLLMEMGSVADPEMLFFAIDAKNLYSTIYAVDYWVNIGIANPYFPSEQVRAFLENNEWSVTFSANMGSTSQTITLDNETIKELTDEEWEAWREQFYYMYDIWSLTHPTYYLKNIPAPELIN